MLKKNRKKIIAALGALLFTLMELIGWQISMKYDTSVHKLAIFQKIGVLKPGVCLLWGLVLWCILTAAIYGLFSFLEKREKTVREGVASGAGERRLWLKATVLLFVVYMFFLWSCYPGFFNYDMGNQLPQMLYADVPFNAHHPLLHTIVGAGLVTLGYHLRSVDLTFGIFLYCVFQMAVCAVCFGYSLRFVYVYTRRKLLYVLGLLFYGFCPPVVIFAMSTTKDVMCYAVLLVALIKLYQVYERLRAGERPRRAQWILTGVFLALSCLLRKNIVYAVVVGAVLAICIVRQSRRAQALLYVSAVAAYLIINNSMIAALDAPRSHTAEALSVPFQQLARLWLEKGEEAYQGEDLAWFEAATGGEDLGAYDPMIADEMKTLFWRHWEVIRADKGRFLSLWIRLGLRYPGIYIQSFLDNTYQAWYPWTEAKSIRGYRYFDETGWQKEFGKANVPAIYRYFVGLKDCTWARIPVLRLLFPVGSYFWVMLLSLFYSWWRKRPETAVVLLLLFMVCGTSLCGPVSDVRYYLILYYMLPVMLGWFSGKGVEQCTS